MSNQQLNELVAFLDQNKISVAFAESVTAGLVSCEFSKALNVSPVFKGGIVVYQKESKMKLLDVKKETLEKFTPESQEVTHEMALGLKALYEVDLAVAVTGLANPGGSETPAKPIGTIFVSVLYGHLHHESRMLFSGNRNEILHQTAGYVFECMEKAIKI